jgi:hypothetical protein
VLGKLYNIFASLALATLLATGAFVGLLFGSGRLSPARAQLIAQVLRGELDNPTATTQPAAGPTDAAETGQATTRAATEDEVRKLRKREHLERLETERAARDLEAQRALLDQVLQHTLQEEEQLAAQRKALDVAAQNKKQSNAALEVGFKKELELVSGLQPRQAKEHILRVWRKQPADAVRLLQEMDESRVKRVLEQFKTPEELQIQSELLEQIRVQGSEGQASGSRKTAGAAAP